ncbi:MAG TPA: UDP-glucose--hexose-1-phosphate uridylyltransferase, partial [Clostridiales bacterium]|nr:UDP-glucose--hexose-1-phosphate uridylyltransferase [Clostridiales bacterium]
FLNDYAYDQGLIKENSVVYRDLFDTKIMGLLTPRPSELISKFWALYKESPVKATDDYYKFSQDTDYIRRYRISRDMKWTINTEYGDLDITINLSKPEKDPKAIAAAKLMKQSSYPKCQLCTENEGYAGRINHPARQNHRIIPIEINNEQWGFQYSPYVYYNEHCIVLNNEHIPMVINKDTFSKLFDFVKLFPHYFVGSNADLPIVGGSILTHEHFQGGNYTFAMAKAPIERKINLLSFPNIKAGIVKWPMSVIRLTSSTVEPLIEAGDYILNIWRDYADEASFILPYTDGEPHNTITPIARKVDDEFQLDLVLRNNITTKEHPLGVYHPHSELHHIKKENIGLIEVMGLAVLPARLQEEMDLLKSYILNDQDIFSDESIAKHGDWVRELVANHPYIHDGNIDEILKKEIGLVFMKVLEDAGVYKRTEDGQAAFMAFIDRLNR